MEQGCAGIQIIIMVHDEFIAKLIDFEPEDGCPVHVVAAVLKPDGRGRTRITSGRGVTAEEAEQRAVAEAAERHAAVFKSHHGIIYASLNELGMSAVDPHKLILLSEAQYDSREKWNQAVESDHHHPARLDPSAKIGWAEAQDRDSGRLVHIPAAHVYLGYPDAASEGFPVPDSSGLAAGHSIHSAQQRAVLELVERDAVSLWWYSRAQRPELRIGAGEIAWFDAFADWLRRANRRFWLLDLGHDLRIPVAAAILCDEHGRDLCFGFAAGSTPSEAAASALCESVQFDLTKKMQARSNTPAPFLKWCRTASIADNAFLRPEPEAPVSRLNTEPDPSAAISRAELHMIFIDLSLPAGGVHVIRAIVPGLRPIWPRFAPGRLYDVPFQLGWTDHKLTEAELNPVPILY